MKRKTIAGKSGAGALFVSAMENGKWFVVERTRNSGTTVDLLGVFTDKDSALKYHRKLKERK